MCVGLLYLISVGKDPRQYAVCLGMLPMLMSYNMQSWTAINTSSGAFFLHLAHALMLSPAPLPQPLLIHCVHCLVAAAAKVADNKPQLASDKLQRCYESPQLGLPPPLLIKLTPKRHSLAFSFLLFTSWAPHGLAQDLLLAVAQLGS